MDIIKLAIRRPITMLMGMLILIILGCVSLSKMEMELMPSMTMPMALIRASYTGAGPEEVDNLVTGPLESALSGVEGLDTITSTSSKGSSMVMLEFVYGTDMNQAVDDIRQKLDRVRLPDDVDTPSVMKMDTNSQAVCNIVFTSDSLNQYELKTLIEDKISPRLERQPGVAEITVRGGREKEIVVQVDRERLEGLGLTMSNISSVLSAENNDQSGGNIQYGIKSYSISIKLHLQSLDDIRQMPIQLGNGSVLQLQDIADINEQDVEITSYSRVNGGQSISVSISKASDGNTVTTVHAIQDELKRIEEDYKNIQIEMTNNQAESIENSINGVLQNILLGAFLSIITLFVFLKNIGLTMVIAVSMPLSIIAAFVLLYFSGTTLNVLSLGGLSIGVGMLVDSSVVAIESIYRYRTVGGYAQKAGTYYGVKEIAVPIVASTLTTVVIFVPFVFAEGMVAELFTDMALAVVFSLLVSVVAALTIVPMMSGNVVGNVHRNHAPKALDFINRMLDTFDKGFNWLKDAYERVLTSCMRHKKKTILIVWGAFFASLCLYPFIGMDLMPSTDEGEISVTATAPSGANLAYINDYSIQIEDMLQQIPEIKKISANISGSSGGRRSGSSQTSIRCTLVDKNDRQRSTDEIVEEVRQMTKNMAGVKISVSASSSSGFRGGGGSGSSVSIYGEDTEVLNDIYQQLKSNLMAIEGVREVSCDLDNTTRQVSILLDKNRLRSYGLLGSSVASQISNSISGTTATTLKTDGTETDIRLSYPDHLIEEFSDLGSINISVGGGRYVPLTSLADITFEDVPMSISNKDQTRYVNVSYSAFGRDTGSLSRDVQELIDQMSLPEGYSLKLGGTTEQMAEVFDTMSLVLLMAIALIYMVMAAQFESLINPFIMFLSIPLALIGVMLLLFLTRESLSMTSMIGLLVLAGIAVNNGIVLIDYANVLRKREHLSAEEAMMKAGPVRLRPILMTALTTILAQLPVIFSTSSNSELLNGMGVVVAGGLATSTFLTLLVIPVMYVYFSRFSDYCHQKIREKFPVKLVGDQKGEEEFM